MKLFQILIAEKTLSLFKPQTFLWIENLSYVWPNTLRAKDLKADPRVFIVVGGSAFEYSEQIQQWAQMEQKGSMKNVGLTGGVGFNHFLCRNEILGHFFSSKKLTEAHWGLLKFKRVHWWKSLNRGTQKKVSPIGAQKKIELQHPYIEPYSKCFCLVCWMYHLINKFVLFIW